jgi:ribosomal protein S18 acetylase RimI-like enzyme
MSEIEVRVRTALPADRDAVVDLIQALNAYEAGIADDRLVSRSAAATYYKALLERIARQDGRLLVASAQERVVGALGLIVQEDHAFIREDVRRHAYVTDLVVHGDWRGQGIGKMLLGEAERLARAKDLKRLVIGVLAGNEAAERLYKEIGFRPYANALVKPLG